MTGYYSVIQYCPDPSRAEAANVGVVLYTESPRRLKVKVSEAFGRVEQFFRPNRDRLGRIMQAARSTATRLTLSADELETVGDLNQFVQTLGNDISMTPPRFAAVEDIEADLARLYDRLVGDHDHRRRRRPVVLPTAINSVFERLAQSGKVWRPGSVSVPVIGRSIDIPFAYRNGVENYVKPVLFASDMQRVDATAAKLAVDGDQLRRHPEQGLGETVGRQLVVVSASASDPATEARVAPVFKAYGVVYVPVEEAGRFADKVLGEAK
jgi:hypothetical protein